MAMNKRLYENRTSMATATATTTTASAFELKSKHSMALPHWQAHTECKTKIYIMFV